MKVSCSKTEYMDVKEKDPSGTVRLQRAEIWKKKINKKVEDFKYLGQQSRATDEVKTHVQAGWNRWRKVSGV